MRRNCYSVCVCVCLCAWVCSMSAGPLCAGRCARLLVLVECSVVSPAFPKLDLAAGQLWLICSAGLGPVAPCLSLHRPGSLAFLIAAGPPRPVGMRGTGGRTSVELSMPCLIDLAYRGQHCKSAIIAAESLTRVPIPPGRPRPLQFIVILDLRATIGNFTWRIIERELTELHSWEREFEDGMLAGFHGCIQGGFPKLCGHYDAQGYTLRGPDRRVCPYDK